MSSSLLSEIIQVGSIGCKCYLLPLLRFLRQSRRRYAFSNPLWTLISFALLYRLQLNLYYSSVHHTRCMCCMRMVVGVIVSWLMTRGNNGLDRRRCRRSSTSLADTTFQIEMQRFDDETLPHAFECKVVLAGGTQST